MDKLRGKKKHHSPAISPDILKNNTILIPAELLPRVILSISGSNNLVDLQNLKTNGFVEINIHGDNNKITMGKNTAAGEFLKIRIGNTSAHFGKANNTEFTVGNNTTFESAQYITYNCNAICRIGNDCMFAFGITLFNTDAHPIIDRTTGKIINKVKGIDIGDHCWIGAHAAILKNTTLANDTIVGWGSVVSGKHETPFSAIGGNPAKLIKSNITWDCDGSNGYISNDF